MSVDLYDSQLSLSDGSDEEPTSEDLAFLDDREVSGDRASHRRVDQEGDEAFEEEAAVPEEPQPRLVRRRAIRSRGWVFTWNNYPQDYKEILKGIFRDSEMRYMAFAPEIGERGTPHLQGFMGWRNARSFTRAKHVMPNQVHLERMLGTIQENKDYCSKEGDLTVYGTLPADPKAQGARGRELWDKALEAAKKGDFEAIDPRIYITQYGNLKRIATEHQEFGSPADGSLVHQWWWGEAGTGKSHKAWSDHPDLYPKPLNKWWDGYQDQEYILLDDVSPDHMKFLKDYMKRWADRYPMLGEVKGGTIKLPTNRKLIVTSNYSLDMLDLNEQDLAALKRRFKVTHFDTISNN